MSKPLSVDHETITRLKRELVAANQKITMLEKLVQDLRDDILSLGKFKDDIKTDLEDEMKRIVCMYVCMYECICFKYKLYNFFRNLKIVLDELLWA